MEQRDNGHAQGDGADVRKSQVRVAVHARPDGPPLLQAVWPVEGLCCGSRYFAALLRGGFRESLDDDRQYAEVHVVLPLPQHAPFGLEAMLAHVAGTADQPRLGVGLLYWHTLVYLGADACLRQYADTWAKAIDVWPRQSPACAFSPAGKSLSCRHAMTALAPVAHVDAELLLPAYARIVAGHVDVTAAADRDRPERLLDPATTLFDRGRLWSLDEIPQIETGCCNFEDRPDCQHVQHEWVAAWTQHYAGYRDTLIAACDRGLARLRSCREKRPSYSINDGNLLDACVDGDPALLSLATATALRDWHQVVVLASPHTQRPFALSHCNLLDRVWSTRLRVRCAADAQNDTGHGSPVDTVREAEEDNVRETKRRRSAGSHMGIIVDSKASFEAALRSAFARTADVVLELVKFLIPDTDPHGHTFTAGVVLAGGCVVEAVQQEPLRAHLSDSDMDLWVVGETSRARRHAFRSIVETLFRELPDHAVTVRGSVVTFALPDAAANREVVQVIYADVCSGGDVISAFDLSHAAAYYGGTSVMTTWDCVWSLVARATRPIDGADGGLVRPMRLERATRKGFKPMDAHCAAAICTDGVADNVGQDDTRKPPHVGSLYRDADALLAAFTYRPIDAREYDEVMTMKGAPTVAVDDPAYWSMPPLYVPFRPECATCRRSHNSNWARGGECTCDLSVGMRLDLPRFSGDKFVVPKWVGLTDRGAAFREQIEEADRMLVPCRCDKTDHWSGRCCRTPYPVADYNENPRCYPGRLRLQCLPTTAVTDAITGRPVDVKSVEDRWVDGRAIFRHTVRLYNDQSMAILTAANLRVYPRCLEAIVDGLNNTIS